MPRSLLSLAWFALQVGDCGSESGWQYTSPERDAILLCGAACEHYKATGLIEIEYGCFIPWSSAPRGSGRARARALRTRRGRLLAWLSVFFRRPN